MVAQSAYLLCGEDEQAKQRAIDSIKAASLDVGLGAIDCDVIYADDKGLAPPQFNETLSYLPSSSKKRVVLIRRIRALRKENREALLRYLAHPSPRLVVVLDAAGMKDDDAFLRSLRPFVERIGSAAAKKLDAFDLCRALIAGNATAAITILHTLLGNHEKPYQILGVLIWQWEDMRDRLGLEQFRKGLQALLQTDLRIKTKKLKEELALEMLVIRLSSLL